MSKISNKVLNIVFFQIPTNITKREIMILFCMAKGWTMLFCYTYNYFPSYSWTWVLRYRVWFSLFNGYFTVSVQPCVMRRVLSLQMKLCKFIISCSVWLWYCSFFDICKIKIEILIPMNELERGAGLWKIGSILFNSLELDNDLYCYSMR